MNASVYCECIAKCNAIQWASHGPPKLGTAVPVGDGYEFHLINGSLGYPSQYPNRHLMEYSAILTGLVPHSPYSLLYKGLPYPPKILPLPV